MVIQGRWKNQTITISDKPNCITVGVERPDGASIYSFDYTGRLWTALVNQISYRRGLNGKIVAKWQLSDGDRERRWLTESEAGQLVESARRLVVELIQAVEGGEAQLNAAMSGRVWIGLRRAAAYDPDKLLADVAAYHQVYRPVGILPPDQYMAVVLQLTEGCSFNTCTFCNFYRDRPFRIKQPGEFRKHIQAVREYLGDGLSLRRTIFLGDANALVTPMRMLLPLVEQIHDTFDVERFGGLFAFLDGFSGEKKSVEDYRRLREIGLKRVYVGLESGNADLLHFLKKPGKPSDAVQAVQTMKAGGIPVGVIVLLGAGGRQYAASHVKDTVEVLNSMGLGLDDLIYFSELIESEGMEYVQDAYKAKLHPLTRAERIAQGETIEAQLQFTYQSGVPHISRYDIREFVY